MKKIMLGNEAVARGLYEAGVRLVSSYPGTPSTEITEFAAGYEEIYAEWAPNEKVAMEVAIGASIAGGRAFCAMKHVGLNVAADPFFIGSYIGVGGGLLIGVADDPGMFSSQNEQDSRHYAIAAKLPCLEPSDSAECLAFTKMAYDFSERFDTPVLLRLNTRISHSRSIVDTSERVEKELVDYNKDPSKRVMMPANAKGRHVVLEARFDEMRTYAESCPFNRIVENEGSKIGIITAGPSFNYAREVFGGKASYFKLGLLNPMPTEALKAFASRFETVYVIEELDDIIETHCKKIGIQCIGKELLPLCDEYSQELLRDKLLGEKTEFVSDETPIPGRPPVLCPGCPHRGMFYLFKKMGLYVSGDIGCYTLGALPALGAMDTTLCMGASISALHGFNKIRPDYAKKSVAVIGDSTFFHSGMTGLVNTTYNKGISTVVILDNRITGMTGHQQNPTSGMTLKGEEFHDICIEDIVLAAGIAKENLRVIDPDNLIEGEQILREELAKEAPSVIIARKPCALLKSVKRLPARTVDVNKCVGCAACMKIGCPCISVVNKKAVVDQTLCVGCGLCKHMCRLGALI